MISCYFIYSGKYSDPFDAMEYFGRQRCTDGKGVTIPSQQRYVEYFADFIKNKRSYEDIELYVKQIDLDLPDNYYFNSKTFFKK